MDGTSTQIGARSIWSAALITLGATGFLSLWLLIKPGHHDGAIAVANWIELACSVATLGFTTWAAWRAWRFAPARGAARWAPLCLVAYLGFYTLGQALYTIYNQILHQSPFPSWADAAYLADYPFFLAGVILLPARPLSRTARWRLLLDGVLVMTAIATFSWYFILGPTALQGGEDWAAKVVGTAYPLGDLIEAACLFLLAARPVSPALRPTVGLLAAGTMLSVVIDSIFDVQSLQGTYTAGNVWEAGWTLAIAFIGLATLTTYRAVSQPGAEKAPATHPAADTPVLWRALAPYAVVPAVGALILATSQTRGDAALRPGLYVGAALLVGVVLLRQLLATRETVAHAAQMGALNQQLQSAQIGLETKNAALGAANAELEAAHDELAVNNRALMGANARLEALATTDPLTGLPNHRAMVTVLDQELERAHRFGRPCALLFLDLDHFKALNDGYGHAAGDTVLREVAAVARRALRGVDVLGRWGGEEFIALLPETDAQAALDVAERVRAVVAAHPFPVGGGAHLSCSIGVAAHPDAATRDGLVDAADRAMYAAKRLGRNQARTSADPAVVALTAASAADSSREDAALVGTVEALASLVDARDSYTGRHTHDVAALTLRLALALGLDASEARMIGLAARLHDVGKVAIPDAVLQKSARLTDEEWTLMRQHPVVGADVVGRVPALRGLAPIIRAHHERWDGRGYPDGLAGEAIPLAARIVGVADAFEAIATDRPYRAARDRAWAIEELRRHAGSQFDPAIVAALGDLLAADPIHSGRASA